MKETWSISKEINEKNKETQSKIDSSFPTDEKKGH